MMMVTTIYLAFTIQSKSSILHKVYGRKLADRIRKMPRKEERKIYIRVRGQNSLRWKHFRLTTTDRLKSCSCLPIDDYKSLEKNGAK